MDLTLREDYWITFCMKLITVFGPKREEVAVRVHGGKLHNLYYSLNIIVISQGR
jgi:hypothetical protein